MSSTELSRGSTITPRIGVTMVPVIARSGCHRAMVSPCSPVSSLSSRSAAASGVSDSSKCPPGKLTWAACVESDLERSVNSTLARPLWLTRGMQTTALRERRSGVAVFRIGCAGADCRGGEDWPKLRSAAMCREVSFRGGMCWPPIRNTLGVHPGSEAATRVTEISAAAKGNKCAEPSSEHRHICCCVREAFRWQSPFAHAPPCHPPPARPPARSSVARGHSP
jgi:hypothetical protein